MPSAFKAGFCKDFNDEKIELDNLAFANFCYCNIGLQHDRFKNHK